ncbi:alpha/beta-hydrolase [Thozetella sp. PMI_491]|nr:alpha/beta-hydrolase [Thozetella sp. PMI_491]
MGYFRFWVYFLLVGVTYASPVDISEPGTVPGTTSHYAEIRGHTYHYLLAEPVGRPNGTILLLHGLPDFSYGWRYQIPVLSELGYQVIVPDMLGYAGTDSPCETGNFAFKQLSMDMAELLTRIVPGKQIIVGGHDWGAGLAYKFAMWYPQLLRGLFTVSIPYLQPWFGPTIDWVDLSVLVTNGTYPTFGYQLQWREPSFDRNFTTAVRIRQFYNTMFGGLTSDGKSAFSVSDGILYDKLSLIGPNPLLNNAEMDVYVNMLLKRGVRGPFNWYRVQRMDWEDQLPIAQAGNFSFKMPSLFIPGLNDFSVPSSYYGDMGRFFDSLTIKPVEAGHWILWEARERVNAILAQWVGSLP